MSSESPQSTILLLDGSEQARAIYRRYLQQDTPQTYKIVEFAASETALDWCRQGLPDLILMDALALDVDGPTFLERLSQQHPEQVLPVVFLTESNRVERFETRVGQKAQDYLRKEHLQSSQGLEIVSGVIERLRLKRDLLWLQKQQHLTTEIASQIRQSFELDSILSFTVEAVRQLLGIDRVFLLQFTPGKDSATVAEGWTSLGQATLQSDLEKGYWQPAEKRTCQVHRQVAADFAAAGLSRPSLEDLSRVDLRANLSVPIVPLDPFEGSSTCVWGLLVAHHCGSTRQWLERERGLLEQVAVQLAIAIQQAELRQCLGQEVQDRQQKEQQLGQSEAQFRALIEQFPQGIARFNLNGELIEVNPSFKAMFQVESADVAGYNFLEDPQISANGHLPLIQSAFAGEITQVPPIFYDHRNFPGLKRSCWTEPFLYPIRNKEGDLVEVVSVMRDVTDLQQTLTALRDSQEKLRLKEEKLRLSLQSAHVGSWNWNIITGELSWNDVHYQLCGLSTQSADPSYELWLSRVHPDDLALLNQKVKLSVEQNSFYEAEYRVIWPDGSIHWLLSRGHVLQNAMGQSYRMLGTVIEISDRKRQEAELREQEDRWQLALEGNNDGIWDWNLKTDTVFLSKRWKEMLGFADSEIENRFDEWASRVHPDDHDWVMTAFQNHLKRETPFFQAEHRIR